MTIAVRVEPDADGYVPNGYVNYCPGYYADSGPCPQPCCMPEAYPQPHVWYCEDGCRAKLRQPGTCINCDPPL